MKRVLMGLLVATAVGCSLPAFAQEGPKIQEIQARYQAAVDEWSRIEAVKELGKTTPKTAADVEELRGIFSRAAYDEDLFEAAIEAVKKVSDKKLDAGLIGILQDEKAFAQKAGKKDFQGKREGEVTRRMTNLMFVIDKLGVLQSQSAAPVLKEYLDVPGLEYFASQALILIGDTSTSGKVKDKAYFGIDVNFAGRGVSEAMTVVRDLEDPANKSQWPKIAKQIFHIKSREVKPYLRRLFNHEVKDVRWEAAGRFRAMVDENDVPAILEMTKNKDAIIRSEGIHAMQNLKNLEFADELIALLNDPNWNVRCNAAKALGYKKIAKAVPFLEKRLNDDDLAVREESYVALYILTGRHYEFQGKSAGIEQKAERQRRFPTFY